MFEEKIIELLPDSERKTISVPGSAKTIGKTYYVASTNGEEYDGHSKAETKEEAIANLVESYDLQPGDSVWVGEYNGYGNGEQFYPSADWLIDKMGDDAYDEGGEYAYDWLPEVSSEQREELEQAVANAIRPWIIKHKLQPGFFGVEKAEQRTVGK
jgi:hypothetical protein